ncbi:hypothetical protein Tdes44962_MAKER01774 [Teratosphaeria destructans]|uniref:DUF4185 domain-containing protein n=1 Tax=Teratosphaeria destructans TaxID=418781 RepID=A0A9W7SXB5_9PEZI|nr:hypothetical protein Tdes44962_MAKER01774 [Teratosphaeria destructans]
MYGITNLSQSYFEVPSSMCGGASSVAGSCGNSTRYAIWPDSRSMPVSTGENGSVALYTWIPNAHITDDFVQLNENPSASLYRADYSDSLEENDVPPAQLLDDSFWSAGSIRYGEYGFVITNGTAYLYGILTGTSGVALAKVSTDSIEDKSAYSYYTNSSWSSTAPSINDSRAAITNAGTGGQGTYYWSAYFDSFVWIGAPYIGDNAIFQIATAPAPEGPWTELTTFYTGEQGSASLGAYSQQAHPGMSKDFGSSNEIYLTYTKVDEGDENGEITGTYSTPIIHVVWE